MTAVGQLRPLAEVIPVVRDEFESGRRRSQHELKNLRPRSPFAGAGTMG